MTRMVTESTTHESDGYNICRASSVGLVQAVSILLFVLSQIDER